MKSKIKNARDDLHKEIHADAVKQAEDSGLPMPHINASNFEHYAKCHKEAVAHFRGMHPKMPQYLQLDKEITQARVDRIKTRNAKMTATTHASKSVTAQIFATLAKSMGKDNENDEYPGQGKKIDYGDFKTLKHVNPTLPHSNPKTPEHINQNIAHLRKLSANNKTQIEHHTFEHSFHRQMHDKILPKIEKAGYTANKEHFRNHAKEEIKFHSQKLNHYTKLQEQTVEKLNQHKAALQKHAVSLKKPAVTTPVKRHFLTKFPAEPAQVTAYEKIIAYDLIKDNNYFKRKARLIHLEIDRDVRLHMKDNPAQFSKDFEAEYQRSYHAHPKYKLLRSVVKKHINHVA